MALVASLLLIACAKDESSDNPLIGTWISDRKIIEGEDIENYGEINLQFSLDNTYKKNSTAAGTYDIAGAELKLNGTLFPFRIKGNELFITESTNYIQVYVKDR